jgi:BCD family chlorophyll transporter-like MFS transporter
MNWLSIFRMGLVQTSLGAIVVLTTSTMNRVMVVELALPAMLPGALVALHYAIQMLRPRMGHGSDLGGKRTPWIVGGMAVLALGGVLASVATAWMATSTAAGMLLAILAFMLIGAGVGAAGTSLLVLVATSVDASRRAPAATIMWTMMIAGFAVTAGVVGANLDPFTPARLVTVTAIVAVVAFLMSLAAVWGVERRHPPQAQPKATGSIPGGFRTALAQVWREPEARCFTVFVFVSMLAFSAQDLILEPFAGIVFGMTPGESTSLSGMQNGGVLVGMLLVAMLGGSARGRRVMPLRTWTIAGCIASAAALVSIAWAGSTGSTSALQLCVMGLGLANGVFAASAIASMMELAHNGHARREGVRIGLWGAAQAVAYAIGGFLGAAGVDLARALVAAPLLAYSTVFVVEALLFLLAAWFASRVGAARRATAPQPFESGAIRNAEQGA